MKKDVSLSETIRRVIEERLGKNKDLSRGIKNSGLWLRSLANEAKKLKIKGPKDLATNIDNYLYGGK